MEGVQPAIPQNPLVAENDTSAALTPAASAAAAATTAATSSTPASVDVASACAFNMIIVVKNVTLVCMCVVLLLDANAASTAAVDARPLVKHRLSAELQTYFEKVTSAVRGTRKKPMLLSFHNSFWLLLSCVSVRCATRRRRHCHCRMARMRTIGELQLISSPCKYSFSSLVLFI